MMILVSDIEFGNKGQEFLDVTSLHALQACTNVGNSHKHVEIIQCWLNRARIAVDGNVCRERQTMDNRY
jgi:hypothetical protein